MELPEGFVEKDDDLAFEEDIARNRYSVKKWWRYIQAKKHASRTVRRARSPRVLWVSTRAHPGR